MTRYRDGYRSDEVDLIRRLASSGQSLCFVGLAGVGKSNLINRLRDRAQAPVIFGERAGHIHMVAIKINEWKGTPSNLWQLLLDALQRAVQDVIPAAPPARVVHMDEEERLRARLQAQVQNVCQHNHAIVFLFDDVDLLLETGPLSLLESLNALREDYRDQVSYLLFTKRLPHVLGRRHQVETKCKFYDLFRQHIYALGPYNRQDALQMLLHLNQTANAHFSKRDLQPILDLAGGHAGLLRVIFTFRRINRSFAAAGPALIEALAQEVDVQEECRRILRSLHPQEARVATRIARGNPRPEDAPTIDHLCRRGILTRVDPPEWFSPVLPVFLSLQPDS
jgi:hypothetical protein